MDADQDGDKTMFELVKEYSVKNSKGFVYILNGKRAATFAKSLEALKTSLGVETKPLTVDAYVEALNAQEGPIDAKVTRRGSSFRTKIEAPGFSATVDMQTGEIYWGSWSKARFRDKYDQRVYAIIADVVGYAGATSAPCLDELNARLAA